MIYRKIVGIKILILISLFIVNIYSQQGWFSINYIAEGNNLNSVYFINDSTGYTISDEGFILFSNNYGSKWQSLKLTESSLNDLLFTNNNGYIVGNQGKIFKTKDGINWNEVSSNTLEKLNAIFFLNADTGYIFGSSSTILKSTDAGETWIELNLSSSFNITDGAFPTPDFGFCVTSEGFLMRTLDSGSSWQYLSVFFGDIFCSIFFTGDSTAYITGWEGDIGFLLKTTDRGNDFQQLYPEAGIIYSSYFFNSEHGFVVGDGGFISETTDGGSNWHRIYTQTTKYLTSIFFTNELNGYAVGGDSTMLRTTDGGELWSLIGSGITPQLTAINFPPTSEIGYTVSADGEVYKIVDNRAELIYRETSVYNSFQFVYFLDEFYGFTGGANGKFYTTTDGGQHWTLTDFRPQDVITMWTIDFYQNQIGIVAAWDKMLKTTDGGQSWTVINSNTSSFDVKFLNEQTLISVGGGGAIFKSSDVGESWIAKNSPTTQSLRSVDFMNEDNGFAIGWNGTVLRTTDGGENWSIINLNTNETLKKVKFVNQTHGYIIGPNGIIYYTSNSGNSWGNQNSTTDKNLTDIFFVDDTTGYIVGYNGTLLKTLDGGGTVKVENNNQTPIRFILYQNYPNPFNPTTKIKFEIALPSLVNLTVYDLLGRKVAILVDEYLNSGLYETEFDAGHLSTGIYFYTLNTENYTETKKLVLIR